MLSDVFHSCADPQAYETFLSIFATKDMEIAQSEVFGPIMLIITYEVSLCQLCCRDRSRC